MKKRSKPPSKIVYRWVRNLHLYIGLFISPFLLIYAISVFFLNHDWKPWSDAETEKVSYSISVPDEENSRELARQIMQQLQITGEMNWVNHNQNSNSLSFPVDKPGLKKVIRVNLDDGSAEVERQKTGVWDAMVFLHEMPGSHLVSIRGNWIYVRIWGWLADATVYFILFVTASGVYMWSVMKAERKSGLIFLGLGVFTFFSIIAVMLR
ncbi:MAG: PepSY-associated TM helix domain-containing protein [Balneolaceae bacterium]|nr:PepSY-associated TM helix domain-containing protein [Balneolaceae bacterium]